MGMEMYKYILICCLLLSSSFNIAQSISRKPVADSNKVNDLIGFGIYRVDKPGEDQKDLDSAMQYFKEAEQLSTKIHFQKGRLSALTYEGCVYLLWKNLEKAKPLFLQVINYYHNHGDLYNEALTCDEFADNLSPDDTIQNGEKVSYYKRAAYLFGRTNHNVDRLLTMKDIAEIHRKQGKYELAKTELIDISVKLKALKYPKIYQTYHLLAEIYCRMADTEDELFYRIAAVNSMEADPDPNMPGFYYYYLSYTYSNMHRYELAIVYAKKCIEIAKKEKDIDSYYDAVNMVVIYKINLHKLKEALSFLETAVKRLPTQNDSQKRKVLDLTISIHTRLGQFDIARKYVPLFIKLYSEEYKTALRTDDEYTSNIFVNSYCSLVEYYIRTKQPVNATVHLERLKSLYKKISPRSKLVVIKEQAKVDSLNGNFLAALKHFQYFKQLNDSVEKAANSNQIAEMDAKYQTSQKEKSLRLMAKQKVIQEAQFHRVSTQRNITIGGVLMLLVVAGLIYISYRHKKLSNLKLQTQQAEINYQNQLLTATLRDKEKLLSEKEWLLKEVHHRVKNNLQIVMSLLNTQSAFLKNTAAVAAIRESQNRVQAISLIHQKLYQDSDITTIYMPAYIADLVKYLDESFCAKNRNVVFDFIIEPIKLDLIQAVPLGLILNEAITNAIKYAFGKAGGQVIILLNQLSDNLIILTISDNGIGLPAKFNLEQASSLGMEMMKALSRQLGGEFVIKNNAGVQISVEFHIEHVRYNAVNENILLNDVD